MSNLSTALAIFVPDLHLSDKMPRGRNESNWMHYQWQVLQELQQLVDRCGGCPVVYAGDLFHHPDASPELLNLAIDHLPPGYAIPGQHDLLHHNYAQLNRTAYYTLMLAKVITTLTGSADANVLRNKKKTTYPAWLCGFPYGTDWKQEHPLTQTVRSQYQVRVAVTHEYVWSKDFTHYPGVEEKYPEGEVNRLGERMARLGFTHVFSGDNHTPLTTEWFDVNNVLQSVDIWNGGTVMARNRNERHLENYASVLLAEGNVVRYTWDRTRDQWKTEEEERADIAKVGKAGTLAGVKKLLDRLNGAIDTGIDFLDKLKREIGTDAELTAIYNEIVHEVEA